MADLLITGRIESLALAEIEAVLGAGAIETVGKNFIITKQPINFSCRGSLLKKGKIIGRVSANIRQDELLKTLLNNLPEQETKITVGLSFYAPGFNGKLVRQLGLKLKRTARQIGLRLRLVPNRTGYLSSAQSLHNHLDRNGNIEFLICQDKNNFVIAKLTHVQDINSYAHRDRGRPMRDTRVGMLPPKLAQIMLSLAQVSANMTVLDPFCGTGVILQEAMLCGANAAGSDIAARMIKMTRANLDWLSANYRVRGRLVYLSQADARTQNWPFVPDAVVSEIYLGRPISSPQPKRVLLKELNQINQLLADTLNNLRPQLRPKTRLVLAIPMWRLGRGWLTLPLVDHLDKFGYNYAGFKMVNVKDLVYSRPNQFVARRILVLARK